MKRSKQRSSCDEPDGGNEEKQTAQFM